MRTVARLLGSEVCRAPGPSGVSGWRASLPCRQRPGRVEKMPETGIFMLQLQWRKLMSWKSPKVVEIALGAEINCYACAEVK